MASPVVTPRSLEPWSHSDSPFRVEILDRRVGGRRWLYFDALPEAMAFAAEHNYGGRACCVESRDMQATHSVESFAALDAGYVFWVRRFGDIETAQAEYERGVEHAKAHGGGYRLKAIPSGGVLEVFSHAVD